MHNANQSYTIAIWRRVVATFEWHIIYFIGTLRIKCKRSKIFRKAHCTHKRTVFRICVSVRRSLSHLIVVRLNGVNLIIQLVRVIEWYDLVRIQIWRRKSHFWTIDIVMALCVYDFRNNWRIQSRPFWTFVIVMRARFTMSAKKFSWHNTVEAFPE